MNNIPQPAPKSNRSNNHRIILFVGGIVVAICVVTTMISFILYALINQATMRVRVDGSSMEPTLPSGSFLVVDKQAYLSQPPHRGDIVIHNLPLNPTHLSIHRVIGLPGETINIKQGFVWINGARLNEPYISVSANYSGQWKLGSKEYFVLGDNRNASADSHIWGSLLITNIEGKVLWIYWPPNRWEKLEAVRYSF
jgi:signal peptidase I